MVPDKDAEKCIKRSIQKTRRSNDVLHTPLCRITPQMKESMPKKSLNILSAGILSSVLLATATPSLAFALPDNSNATENTENYIVTYEPGTNTDENVKNVKGHGAEVKKTFTNAIHASSIKANPAKAKKIAATKGVKSVEVDQKFSVSDTQNSAPWGLDRVDQKTLPLSGTYNYESTAGQGVDVYIVDSGVLSTHTDFTGRISTGYTGVSDGLGSSDCNGHGTHVAGTVAGTTAGLAKKASIIPVRVFGCSGSGYTSDVIAGMDWVASNHQTGKAAVANLSIGGGASDALDTAVKNVINDGVTVAVAAGNSTVDACTTSPARVPEALTAAASDRYDAQASFSNFGSCVDMYAPGVAVTSDYYTSNTATASMSGTSMASPHIAGAAAVLLSRNPALTPAQVNDSLISSATTGVITNPSAGTPNRLLFLPATSTTVTPAPAPAPAPAAPSAPTSVSATAKVESAGLTWNLGADNGTAITSQTINVYEGSTKVGSVNVAANVNSVTITGLPSGKTYNFTVNATSAAGTGAESAKSNAVTILSVNVPAVTTNVKGTAGYGTAALSWTKGSDGGSALTSQTVTVYNGTAVVKTVNVPVSATSATIDGLYAGTVYTFTVKSANKGGSSAESAKSAGINPLAKAPNTATSVTATANAASANLSWVKGSDNGSALTSQVITVYSGTTKIGTATVSGAYNSVRITGLTVGKSYTFTIKEVNAKGTSIESSRSNAVTPY